MQQQRQQQQQQQRNWYLLVQAASAAVAAAAQGSALTGHMLAWGCMVATNMGASQAVAPAVQSSSSSMTQRLWSSSSSRLVQEA
jgi:hypothetical protein